jgi:hypothetical protein
MKYALECEVESTMKITADVKASIDNRDVVLITDENGVLSRIRLVAVVPDPSTCRSWYEVDNETSGLRVYYERDHELHDSMIASLQALESGLAFTCPVHRIRWHSARFEFIPETEEESVQIKVPHLHIRPGADQAEQVTAMEIPAFVYGMHIADKCRDILGPLSFYREGLNALRRFRNIQAFFHFYFVLEGLYGSGQYETKKVKQAFARSKILTSVIDLCIHQGFPTPFHGKNQTIEQMIQGLSKTANLDGVLHLMVRSRGQLHHFLNPAKSLGTPLTDDQYECLANLSEKVTRLSLLEEIRLRIPAAPSVRGKSAVRDAEPGHDDTETGNKSAE